MSGEAKRLRIGTPPWAFPRDLDVAHRDRTETYDISIVEIGHRDATVVDERTVRAAVVQHARATGPLGDDRVTPGHVRVLEPQIGERPSPDVGDRTVERHQQRGSITRDGQIAPGWSDAVR